MIKFFSLQARVLAVTDFFNISVNDFGSKTSTRFNRTRYLRVYCIFMSLVLLEGHVIRYRYMHFINFIRVNFDSWE